MYGFDDPSANIFVTVKDTGSTADGGLDGVWQIPAGSQTVALAYGLMTTVGGTRYLVPWTNVSFCSQVQPPPSVLNG